MNIGNDKTRLRNDILEKFKTIKFFCLQADYNYRNFREFLNSRTPNPELLQEAFFKCENTQINHIDGKILESDREAVRKCVLMNFKSFSDFCRKHNDFDSVYMSNIIGGRLSDETPRYKLLIRILERDYDLNNYK